MSFNQDLSLYETEVAVRNNFWVLGFVKSGNKEGLIVELNGEPRLYYYSQLRVPSNSKTQIKVEVGCEIEVPLVSEGVSGWSRVAIDKIRGGFFTVSGGENVNLSYTIEEARPVCQNGTMDVRGSPCYHYATITVPTQMRDIMMAKESIKKLTNECSSHVFVSFNDSNGKMSFISPNLEDIDHILNVSDLHIQFLKAGQRLASKMASAQYRSGEVPQEGTVVDKFPVEKSLMCHSIGSKGANIMKARAIDGIQNISVDDETSTIRIMGVNEICVKDARSILEYVELVIPAHKDLINKIVGQKGDNLQKIVDRSDVKRVYMGKSSNDMYDIHVVGTKKNVRSAQIMLNFVIKSLTDLKDKLDELRELRKKCKESYPVRPERSSEDESVNEGVKLNDPELVIS